MDFKELVEKRRCCRAFLDDPVTEEQTAAIVRAGQWAPSPLNRQPFEFIAVTDTALKAGIQKAGDAARQAVADLLGVPGKFEITGAILLGKPAGAMKVPPRKDPVIHKNGFSG